MTDLENMQETNGVFEDRKRDHIRLSLDPQTQSQGLGGFDSVELTHEALPEIDFAEIETSVESLGQKWVTPFYVSSMTAGHDKSHELNLALAQAAAKRGWLMGVGSQRRELWDEEASLEWQSIRRLSPETKFLSNLGLSQLIRTPLQQVKQICDSLDAVGMIIHTNPLQECLQPEGTPQFRGGAEAIAKLSAVLGRPVILKETGCGFSKETLIRLKSLGLAAVDVSGLGGTHWGRIEGLRSNQQSICYQAAQTFKNWGIGTVDSLCHAVSAGLPFEIWGSGGVRSGLDAAKLLALGANRVGIAQPLMEAALRGQEEIVKRMELLEFELKTALFCTGSPKISQLKGKFKWRLQTT